MAVNYNIAVKLQRMTATRDYFANGTLEIMTAADVVLVAFSLAVNGGSVSDDVWNLAFQAATVSATGTGTAANAQIKNSSGAAHLTGLTVGLSGADINLDNTSIASGQSVTLTTATIRHA